MSEPTGVVSHLTGAFVDGVPKYLVTILDYVVKRPRRFFLQYEREPQRYIAPWPFLLANALLAASLALAVDRIGEMPGSTWDWSLYWTIVPAGLLAHLLVVGCGALAAVFTRQRVTLDRMMTAFAYASVWVLAYVPALTAIGEHRRDSLWYTASVCLAIGSELCHIGYIVTGFVRLNYLAGRKAVRFVVVTLLLTGAPSVIVGVVLARFVPGSSQTHSAVPEQQVPLRHYYVPHCTRATLHGSVGTETDYTLVWFEWGKTPALGNITERQVLTRPGEFDTDLSSLDEQTTYFYRGVMSNKYGTRRGALHSFATQRCD